MRTRRDNSSLLHSFFSTRSTGSPLHPSIHLSRMILICLIIGAFAVTMIAEASGHAPEHATVTVEAYTKDAVPKVDQVTIRVYPANARFNNASSPTYETALAVTETEEGLAKLKLAPGEYNITAWHQPEHKRDGDLPRLVASKRIVISDTLQSPYITLLTEKTESFTLTLRIFDITYPGVPLDEGALRVELRGVRKELPFIRESEEPYTNFGHWKGFKEYGTDGDRRLTYQGYFLATGLDREEYLVQIWNGGHLLARYKVFMDDDKRMETRVDYERSERTNFIRWEWKEQQEWLAQHRTPASETQISLWDLLFGNGSHNTVYVWDEGDRYRMNSTLTDDEYYVGKDGTYWTDNPDSRWAKVDPEVAVLKDGTWTNISYSSIQWDTVEVLNNATQAATVHFGYSGEFTLDQYYTFDEAKSYLSISAAITTPPESAGEYSDLIYKMRIEEIVINLSLIHI